MPSLQPTIGDWYRIRGGDTFEVVALDADDGTIEVQYFDGTVEEMDIEDWQTQNEEGLIEDVEPPEDFSGSVDVEVDDEPRSSDNYGSSETYDSDRRQWASPLEGLDMFE